MISDIEDLLSNAVSDVLTTMLNIDIQREAAGAPASGGAPQIASSVGFIGKVTGVVFLYASGTFAKTMTGRLLSMQESEIEGDEMVNDAMGELANMVVGHIKSRLCDRGMPCALTIPSIVRGQQFCIEPVSSTQRCVLNFSCNGNRVAAEALIRPVAN